MTWKEFKEYIDDEIARSGHTDLIQIDVIEVDGRVDSLDISTIDVWSNKVKLSVYTGEE